MVCGLSVEEYRGGPRAKEMETERGWSLNEAYHWFGSATPFLLLKKEIVGWARVCHQGYHSKLLVLLVTILIEASKSIIDRTWSTIATFFGRISHFLVQSMQYSSVYLFGLFCRLLLPLLLLLLAVLCDFVRRFLTSSLVSGVVTPRDRSENVLRGFYCFFFCSGPLPVMSLLCLGVVRVLTFVLVSRWWKYEKISTRYRPMSKKSRRSTALFYQRRKRMKVCRSTIHLLLLGNLNLVSFHCRGQARTWRFDGRYQKDGQQSSVQT